MNTSESIRMTRSVDRESLNGQVETPTRENIKMMKEMDMEK